MNVSAKLVFFLTAVSPVVAKHPTPGSFLDFLRYSLYNLLYSRSIEKTCAASYDFVGFDGYDSGNCECSLVTFSAFGGYNVWVDCLFTKNRCLVPPNETCSAYGYLRTVRSSGSPFGGKDVFEYVDTSMRGLAVNPRYALEFGFDLEFQTCFGIFNAPGDDFNCDSCEICEISPLTFKFDCSNINITVPNATSVPGPATTSCVSASFIPKV